MEKNKLQALLISSNISIKEAMQKLDYTAEQILFVVEKGNRLVGTITDGDIRRGIIHGLAFNDEVKKLMHTDFIKVAGDMHNLMQHVKEIMLKDKVEQVPVISKDGAIEDVIIWTDVLGENPREIPVMSCSNPVVIMAGGKGARLDPFTRMLPKPLIPIGEKPVIEIIMDKFFQKGFKNFIFTLNYKKEYIKIFFKENKFPYAIDWVEENEYTGTAGSLALLAGKVKEPFFVTNCDILLDVDYQDILKWHISQGNMMTLVGCHKEIKIPYGILEMDEGRLKKFIEKPNYDMVINTGVYLLEPDSIKLIPKGKPMEMNHLIEEVAKKGKVSVYPVHNGWLDLGQWGEYKKSIESLSDQAKDEKI
ncbi:MAG: sugar phosphate nucleotidyltransferase [Candidatus Omnitrophica bacterium]|nr:sugar phosphate nucleotidyltransferase [Candidatus Omnitrophota bacterium]